MGGWGGSAYFQSLGGLPADIYIWERQASRTLIGGSGGSSPGRPGACTVHGGAGGGALQLSARTLTFTGEIDASGGGGAGGIACGSNGTGGAGGGAGGVVFLDIAELHGNGVIGANGGAGGEGAGPNGEPGAAGADGDAHTGGLPASLASGGAGGDGAGVVRLLGGAHITGGDVPIDYNGGGGGGGFGGIYYGNCDALWSSDLQYLTSPLMTLSSLWLCP